MKKQHIIDDLNAKIIAEYPDLEGDMADQVQRMMKTLQTLDPASAAYCRLFDRLDLVLGASKKNNEKKKPQRIAELIKPPKA